MNNAFPGYEFVDAIHSEDGKPHNYYKGFDVGFGGFVYAEPGMYNDVTVIDISSQHPSSIIAMNCFGEYTKNFKDLLDARIAIKHKDFDTARKMFGGKLAPYLEDESQAKLLTQALKIAINSCYGLTSASFDNPMRDPRNKNNIVALRGALFMIDLKEEVEKRGYRVVAIKTDSMKIEKADQEILDFAFKYGKTRGYNFEVENVFEKMCLVNNAVFIAKCAENDPEEPGIWKAVGAQFAQPYVFKTLFSHEPITLEDMCETKSVATCLYLDMNEDLGEDHDYHFIGKVGQFCPILPGCGGGQLMRLNKDGGYSSATGAKGYRWMESEMVRTLKKESDIDKSYYQHLVDEAVKNISQYGDIEMFID